MTAVTTPSNGTAVIASGTTVTYTPDAGFTGTDSLDYTLSDGADTDTGIVTVTLEAAGNVGGQGGTLAPPSDLTATPGSAQLALDWTDPGNSNIIKYQHSADGGTTFTDIPGSSAATTSYTVSGLTNGNQYTVGVRSINDSRVSSPATETATAGWPAPTNLVATAGDGRVTLEWDRGDSAIANYVIRQGVTGSGSFSNTILSAGNGATRSFTVINLTNGTEFTFMVGAGALDSDNIAEFTGLTDTVTATPWS